MEGAAALATGSGYGQYYKLFTYVGLGPQNQAPHQQRNLRRHPGRKLLEHSGRSANSDLYPMAYTHGLGNWNAYGS